MLRSWCPVRTQPDRRLWRRLRLAQTPATFSAPQKKSLSAVTLTTVGQIWNVLTHPPGYQADKGEASVTVDASVLAAAKDRAWGFDAIRKFLQEPSKLWKDQDSVNKRVSAPFKPTIKQRRRICMCAPAPPAHRRCRKCRPLHSCWLPPGGADHR